MLKSELVRTALAKAMQVRSQAKVSITDAISVYDFVEGHGIEEVRFAEIPTLEELYWKDERKIIVGSLRPSGRQAINCAHGFGHHAFGHGMCITSVTDGNRKPKEFDPNEFLAECFACFFLMPKTTVCHGFAARGWRIDTCTPLQVHTIACWLGVGYGTLIQHLRDTLKLISWRHAEFLLKTRPIQLRSHTLGQTSRGKMIVVDRHWKGRAIDLEVGDFLLLPDDLVFEGEGLDFYTSNSFGTVVFAVLPGCSGQVSCSDNGWNAPVRICRPAYRGRNIFRFEEDPDYERYEFSSN